MAVTERKSTFATATTQGSNNILVVVDRDIIVVIGCAGWLHQSDLILAVPRKRLELQKTVLDNSEPFHTRRLLAAAR